ncbi:MAG TPA: glycosyltransferase 87 family protein [Actinomycetota bacterium]|nr:glycosyltransferase 87 family protein [Actinomycetota bacterium]
MSRRALIALIAAFVATRALTGYLADHPEHYGPPDSKVTGDSGNYERWASEMLTFHLNPYSEFGMEYPPGAIPFIVLPGVEKPVDDSYRMRFVVLMVAVDLVGFLALLVLARRWGSSLGPWLWVGVVPLLGPITYNRLDLLPAVATILAVERFSARSWFGGGGWLGYGVVAKVYPALFLPVAFAAARRKQILLGAAVVGALFLVPYIGFLDDVYRNVLGYHTDRGIQIESLWGFVLLFASKLGHAIGINFTFGALHVDSTLAPFLEGLSQALSLGVVVLGVWLAHRARTAGRDMSGPELGGVMFMVMAGTMAVGSVFSPQFMVWLGALAAVVLCDRTTWLRVPALAVLPAALMTQMIYPFFYGRVVATDMPALVLLASRNFLVLFVAVETFLALRGRSAARLSPATAEPEPAG